MEIAILKTNLINENSEVAKINITDIVKNYSSRLQSFIRKRVNSEEDAEDILQDVFYNLVESDTLMKPIDHMLAWLYTVARNRIIDLYRKKKPEPLAYFSDEDEDDSNIFEEIGEFIFDNANTPDTEYLKNLIWTQLDKALSELPEEQKNVFELTEIKGLSFKEISDQTGLPVNTLLSRKRYAVLHLRQRLKVLYDELINY